MYRGEGKLQFLYIAFLFLIMFLLLNSIRALNIGKKEVSSILAALAGNQIDIERNLTTIRLKSLTPKIRVEFWKAKANSFEKGEYLGCAVLIDGKLLVDVKDPHLKKILENPYIPVGEMTEEGTVRDWQVSYLPGSLAHIKAIAREAWRWGYIAEIQPASKN